MIEKYFFWFMYAFAGEALVSGLIILFVLQWVTKLHNYVRSHYPDYYEKNLSSPLYAGNQTVFDQQLRALKNTYFGQMPDELSRYYQRRLRRLAIISLVALASAFVTFLVSVIVTLLGG